LCGCVCLGAEPSPFEVGSIWQTCFQNAYFPGKGRAIPASGKKISLVANF
jgi:hypothetical protein